MSTERTRLVMPTTTLFELRPYLDHKWDEYILKDGDANNAYEFWRWLAGLDHRCFNPETDVVISKTKLDDLVEDSVLLSHLEAAGVDNWDGYSEAVRGA